MTDLYRRHEALLKRAIDAIGARAYFSAYPESASPKVYGETAKAEGDAAFEALLGKTFVFDDKHPSKRLVGAEASPYGKALDVRYPTASVDKLIAAIVASGEAWGRASVETRAGVALETLARLNKQSFLIADAVQHTSGQSWGMAFQAGGPHAQDRGLEAVAYAVAEMNRAPRETQWEKPQGKGEPLRLAKRFRVVPRVLPVAITLKIMREVLAEAGFDPNVALLAADEPAAPITRDLVQHPAVKIIDFTGGPAFGSWLRQSLKDKLVYTEEAGVNAIVIDSTANFRGMCDNIAFSLSLYSGQMCTAPQNIFVPRGGIETNEGHKSFEEAAKGIADAVDRLLAEPARAQTVLGAIQGDATLERVKEAASFGRVVRASAPIAGVERSATPLILAVEAGDERAWREERFGPISFVIATESTADSLKRAETSIRDKG